MVHDIISIILIMYGKCGIQLSLNYKRSKYNFVELFLLTVKFPRNIIFDTSGVTHSVNFRNEFNFPY